MSINTWLFILLLVAIIIAQSCGTLSYPSGVCMEFGGIRVVSANYVFCNVRTIAYDRKKKKHFRRDEEWNLPEVDVQVPRNVK